ncbi:MAG: DUF4250 domain-containing protein, partial [Lachnospiraceae bacterium]|nr:DUF4250 domain-containing protein [Lachnospiraceae bacterium]
MGLPKDPVMLLSVVNTKLRDEYSSLTELCAAYSIPDTEITEKLKSINYTYDTKTNQF